MNSYMEKEIFEQPDIINELLKRYIKDNNINFRLPKNINKVVFVASGSSYHCAKLGSEIFTRIGNVASYAEYASEYGNKKSIDLNKNTLFVFLSQSGETVDTLSVAKIIKKQGYKILAITNTENSSLWKLADYKMFCNAGKENAIASTKSFSAQFTLIYILMLKILANRDEDITKQVSKLNKLPKMLKDLLKDTKEIQKIARLMSKYNNIVILGNNMFYPLAKEAALKIKETSYINSNAYPFGEFMHGHSAVLNNKGVVLAITDNDNFKNQKVFLSKLKTNYKAKIVALNLKNTEDFIDIPIITKMTDKISQMFSILIIIQLLSLNCAKALGRNIDKPHGLTKVVNF